MAAMAVESLLVYGGMLSGYHTAFHVSSILKFPLPEIWRLVTPFLLTRPKFNALWDLYMFWTYSTKLELGSSRFSQPGDFAFYIAFLATSILVSSVFFELLLLPPRLSARSEFCICHGSW